MTLTNFLAFLTFVLFPCMRVKFYPEHGHSWVEALEDQVALVLDRVSLTTESADPSYTLIRRHSPEGLHSQRMVARHQPAEGLPLVLESLIVR